jgi:hypothetical protein
MAAGASLVLCRTIDHLLLERRMAAERVTAVCGPIPDPPASEQTAGGIRRLGIPHI